MTIADAITDAAALLGGKPLPASPALTEVEAALAPMQLRLAIVGADEDAFRVPVAYLIARAETLAEMRGEPHPIAGLARLLHAPDDGIRAGTLGTDGLAPRRLSTLIAYMSDSEARLPATLPITRPRTGRGRCPGAYAPIPDLVRRRRERAAESSLPPLLDPLPIIGIDGAVARAAMALGQPAPRKRLSLSSIDGALRPLGLRLAVVDVDEDPLQIPHYMLVRRADDRADDLGERGVRSRLSRLLSVDRAVITRLISGKQRALGADRAAILLRHLRDPAAVPLPDLRQSPGAPRGTTPPVMAVHDMRIARRDGSVAMEHVTAPATLSYDSDAGQYRLEARGTVLAEGPARTVKPVLCGMYRVDAESC